jgi:hypothetical protein
MQTGIAVNKSQKKISDFPTCVQLDAGSGPASKLKVGSGSGFWIDIKTMQIHNNGYWDKSTTMYV